MVVAFSAFIIIHEAGHYWTARATGMKATEFFLGFGPRLWSFRRGETEFGVKALPLGGYVRIAGMSLAEEVDPADLGRTYRDKPFWKKSVVVLSGVALNFFTAFVLLFGLFWYLGERIGTTEVRSVRTEITGSQPTPAAEVGLVAGDVLEAIDGVVLTDWDRAVEIIRSRPGQTVTLTYIRDGFSYSVPVTLGSSHPGAGEGVGFLGVSPTTRRLPVGLVTVAGRALNTEWAMVTGILGSFSRIFSLESLVELGGVLVGNMEVSQDIRPVSPLGLITIGAQASELGSGHLILILAAVNVTLGLFNSLPLYPLDGGHFAVALYQKVTGRPLSHRTLLPIAAMVLLFMLFLGLVAVVLDIVNPLSI